MLTNEAFRFRVMLYLTFTAVTLAALLATMENGGAGLSACAGCMKMAAGLGG